MAFDFKNAYFTLAHGVAVDPYHGGVYAARGAK